MSEQSNARSRAMLGLGLFTLTFNRGKTIMKTLAAALAVLLLAGSSALAILFRMQDLKPGPTPVSP